MVQQQEDADHLIVQRFFRLKGLIAERIPEMVIKTPDFKIRRDVGSCRLLRSKVSAKYF